MNKKDYVNPELKSVFVSIRRPVLVLSEGGDSTKPERYDSDTDVNDLFE